MANLTESPVYQPTIYELAVTDKVQGGPGGVANLQAQELANRTFYLKQQSDASVRIGSINQVTGSYLIDVSDIGKLVSVHDPLTTSLNLPALSSFPKGQPLNITINDAGTRPVSLNAAGSDVIENNLNDGLGVGMYRLLPGMRVTLIATIPAWVVVVKSAPVNGFGSWHVGDAVFSFGPVVSRPGWLLCDGAEVAKADYPELFAVVDTLYGAAADPANNFLLPDMRDAFPRVYNGSGVQDTGRVFGTKQADAFQGHTFGYPSDGSKLDRSLFNFGTPSDPIVGVSKAQFNAPGIVLERAHFVTDDVNGTPRVGSETRPLNITVNGYIKAY